MSLFQKLALVFSFIFFINANSYAIDINDAFNKLNEVQVDNIKNATPEDIVNQAKEQVSNKVADIENVIKTKVDEVTKDIKEKQEQIESSINQVQTNIAKFTAIRQKVESYVAMAKIIAIALIVVLALLFLLIFRLWFKFGNIGKIIKAMGDYRGLQKEVDQLRAEVAAVQAIIQKAQSAQK